MEKGLVTVVLPIYNVEKYLNKCIESVVGQTYTNLEIILVDDSSPDNCPQICEQWAKKDSRIKVIHKNNEGLGMARNTGIDNATGEYICFFDSDDYVALDTIEKLYGAISTKRADAVIFGFHKCDVFGNVIKTVIPPKDKDFFSEDEVLNEFLPELIAPSSRNFSETRYYMSACMFMYSLETIKNVSWRFVSERQIISEDVCSLLDLFAHINSVAVVPEAFYFYRENIKSLSKKYMPGRYEKIRHFYTESIKLCERHGYSQEIKNRMIKPYMGFVLSALKQEITSGRKYRQIRETVKVIIDDDVLQSALKEQNTDNVNSFKKIVYWTMKRKLYDVCIFITKLRVGL